MPYVTSFERMGWDKGFKQGFEEGLREGLLESIALDLETKARQAVQKLMAKAKAVHDLDELSDLMRFINAAKTVEEVRRRLTRADRARRLRGPGRHLLARQHGSSPNGPAAGQRGAVGTKRARS